MAATRKRRTAPPAAPIELPRVPPEWETPRQLPLYQHLNMPVHTLVDKIRTGEIISPDFRREHAPPAEWGIAWLNGLIRDVPQHPIICWDRPSASEPFGTLGAYTAPTYRFNMLSVLDGLKRVLCLREAFVDTQYAFNFKEREFVDDRQHGEDIIPLHYLQQPAYKESAAYNWIHQTEDGVHKFF